MNSISIDETALLEGKPPKKKRGAKIKMKRYKIKAAINILERSSAEDLGLIQWRKEKLLTWFIEHYEEGIALKGNKEVSAKKRKEELKILFKGKIKSHITKAKNDKVRSAYKKEVDKQYKKYLDKKGTLTVAIRISKKSKIELKKLTKIIGVNCPAKVISAILFKLHATPAFLLDTSGIRKYKKWMRADT